MKIESVATRPNPEEVIVVETAPFFLGPESLWSDESVGEVPSPDEEDGGSSIGERDPTASQVPFDMDVGIDSGVNVGVGRVVGSSNMVTFAGRVTFG